MTYEHGDIIISKLTDLASPILLQTCSSRKTISKARIEFMRADGQGQRIKYFEIELENVLIDGVTPTIHEGDNWPSPGRHPHTARQPNQAHFGTQGQQRRNGAVSSVRNTISAKASAALLSHRLRRRASASCLTTRSLSSSAPVLRR